MQASYSSRIKYGVLLLVCILHLFIALLFFFTLFDKKPHDILLTNPEPIDLKKDWALRTPAPIKFYDPTDDTQDEHTQPTEQTEVALAEEPQEKITEETAVVETAQRTEQIEERILEKPMLSVASTPMIERIPIDFTPKKKESVTAPKEKVTHVKQHSAPPSRRPLTLADLANMYQKNIAEAPPEHMFLQGSPDKLPPDRQISFERYKTKINTIINDMYKIYKNEMGAIPANISIQLYVEMARNGNFKTVYIKNSSGYPLVDRCVMKIYQEAGDRFPPIPKGLEEELFKGAIILRSSYYAPAQGNVWLPF